MNDYFQDYWRVAIHSPSVRIADVSANVKHTLETLKQASKQGAELSVFPEMGLTAYTCQDLFLQPSLLCAAEAGLAEILAYSKKETVSCIVGLPVFWDGALFNCAAFIHHGRLLGLVPKTVMPNRGEYYEARWFCSASILTPEKEPRIRFAGQRTWLSPRLVFTLLANDKTHRKIRPPIKIAIEICEDLWSVNSPSITHSLAGAHIICNLSASTELLGKRQQRRQLLKTHSQKLAVAYLYATAGPSESSSDAVFSGHNIVYECGTMLAESKKLTFDDHTLLADLDLEKIRAQRLKVNRTSFACIGYRNIEAKRRTFIIKKLQTQFTKKLYRPVSVFPFLPTTHHNKNYHFQQILDIQAIAVARRIKSLQNCPSIIGLSGGLDSTLALCVSVLAYEKLKIDYRSSIIAINLPGPGSGATAKNYVKELCKLLKIKHTPSIDISTSVANTLDQINHKQKSFDRTFENIQARYRTYILLNMANLHKGIVLGTADLSEIALGWCTYGGDQLAMYHVNCGLPKTLVREVLRYCAHLPQFTILRDNIDAICQLPISPELLPVQNNNQQKNEITHKTEQILGPFELHDFFLYYFMNYGYSSKKLVFLAKLAFAERYSQRKIEQTVKIFKERFYTNQFKRSAIADGVKIIDFALSPRADWRLPSDLK